MTKKIAITGLSFRFPGTNKDQYWQDMLDGKNLVTEVAQDRWAQDAFLHPDKKHPGTSYTFAAGSIGDISGFDAGFFGISPREAALMDPQQRLLLELSWEAIENSGTKVSSLSKSKCGVFIGIASADYSYRLADDLGVIDSSTATGNTASVAANRISYFLDLRGPSMAIDTACSSSLVAFHQACQSIRSGESDYALAGGVSLHLHPYGFITFAKASMLSRSGRCNVFDSKADGYVRSEGGGVFFLKDYDKAVADGDPILAVVAGSAVNTDGRKSGLTVPNHRVQADLLRQAYTKAGIDPQTIDYLEAHGTGTAVGDPIETRAIGDALGSQRNKTTPLLIGSVKSNMGHLETASGVAGLVKAIYAIKNRVVPATIGIKEFNPNIHFSDWNIEVAIENRELKQNGTLTVGVNSFGFGGSNAHIILQSAETIDALSENTPHQLSFPIIVTAKDGNALKTAALDFSKLLLKEDDSAIVKIAHNAVFRRDWHSHRLVVFGEKSQSIAKALEDFSEGQANITGLRSGTVLKKPKGPAFIYSGNGSQWQGMGKRLLDEEPLFAQTIQKIDRLFSKYADFSIEKEFRGENGDDRYELTEIAQPALFAFQVGVTVMLQSRGITPSAVAGHSVGEVAAAWASGGLSLEDAITVIYHRSRLQGRTRGNGAMTAVGVGKIQALAILDELKMLEVVTLAGSNSPRGVTIAGNKSDLVNFEVALKKRGIAYKRLNLDYAFHSPAMDVLKEDIHSTLKNILPKQNDISYHSTVTGTALNGSSLDASYWWKNVRQPVLFEEAIQDICNVGTNIFIEISPHSILRNYIKDTLNSVDVEGSVITTATKNDDSAQKIWDATSELIVVGASVQWEYLLPASSDFISLPNYPWQREPHWHPVSPQSLGLLYRSKQHSLLGYQLAQHELTWENQIDVQRFSYLADHVVADTTVFPGTGYAEIALAGAQLWSSESRSEIEELEIFSPLIINEQAKLTRFHIDQATGAFTIKAKELEETEAWTLHSSGRILEEPNAVSSSELVANLPKRHPDFDADSHEQLTLAAGLVYGSAFRCIDYGWIESGSAIAVFNVPDGLKLNLSSMHIHPALLDCTFQLIIQLLKDNLLSHLGSTFVPTKIGRITFNSGKGIPHSCKATLLKRMPHSLTAEFSIYDESGAVIAIVEEVRFKGISLNKSVGNRLRYLDYHQISAPHRMSPRESEVAMLDRLLNEFAEISNSIIANNQSDLYASEVDPLLDSLCGSFTDSALHQIADDKNIVSNEVIAQLNLAAPGTIPYLSYILESAENDRVIEKTEDGWKILSDVEDGEIAQTIWRSLVNDYPDYFQIIHSVGRVGLRLNRLLDGTNDIDQAITQESSLSALFQLSIGANNKQKIAQKLSAFFQLSAENLVEGERLRILEISYAQPNFLLDICPTLDKNKCDYVVASSQQTTLNDLHAFKDSHPGFDTQLITVGSTEDLNIEVGEQYQIVLMSLDFVNLQDALQSLNYAYKRLAPGGSVVLLGQHPTRWMDFVFGTQANWWSESTTGQLLSPQQQPIFWQKQFELLGFSSPKVINLSENTVSGSFLVLAQSDNNIDVKPVIQKSTKNRWLILQDENTYSNALAIDLHTNLISYGIDASQVELLLSSDSNDITVALTKSNQLGIPYTDIVYLSGLNKQVTDVDHFNLGAQVNRCAHLASLVNICENAKLAANCWIVTREATSNLYSSLSAENRPQEIISADTPLWGFARTLQNEVSNLVIRQIDIEEEISSITLAAALCLELVFPDNEQEIMLKKNGKRFVPRLRTEPHPQEKTYTALQVREKSNQRNLRLGFDHPGQLRNLHWSETPRTGPEANEIEIDVQATGLNFRDIMYSLGLLSDEAVENGFAGPTLGLEFSGTVVAVGSNVHNYAEGDQVVGFGPSCFSNRVITQASAITPIPSGMSFEAAATIPSAFFTVYYALKHLAHLEPGEKILIHGAAGGVGIAAIQLAQSIGAEIYATAGSDDKRDFLRLMGVKNIFDSRSLDFANQILAITDGKGVDVVLNSLAGEAINRNFHVLKPFGRFLELGKRDFYENTKIGLRPFRNNISYFGIDADQLMKERPDLTGRLFAEVMQLFSTGKLHPLPFHTFDAGNVIDAFRYMQQARQIGKIVVTYKNGIVSSNKEEKSKIDELQLGEDGCYLITGGLSGFGLKTAEWLVKKGARHLVLISRSGANSEESKVALSSLRKNGVTVLAEACDVTNQQALRQLLEKIEVKLPPLRGIVHAAMVIDDGLIHNMNAEQIERVFAPKILGAHYLNQLTQNMDLDFFVLFSSATTLFGNPGQGNYVAANMWLEAFANNRIKAGLPATCVRWGAIDDVGFLARNEKIKDALQNRMGGSAIKSDDALDSLEAMLINNRSGLGILELDWKSLARFLPSAASPKFEELSRQTGESSADSDNSGDIQRLIKELSNDELLLNFSNTLRSEVSEILRISPEKIDINQSLYEMGMDSLMGVELMVALESRFGVRLSVMALSETPSIIKLTERIILQLKESVDIEDGQIEQENSAVSQVQQIAMQHGSNIRQEDIEILAEKINSESGNSNQRMIH